MTNRPSDRPTFLNPHVRSRMELRGITTEAIDWVLANYHTQFPAAPRQGVKPAIIYQGTYDGRELQVYVQRDSHPPYVKTAAWRDSTMQPVTYDADADVLYVRLNDGQSARQSRLGDLRIIDFDDDGKILGVEFVDASGGADLRDLPFAQRVEQLIHDSGLPIKLYA